jgi:hypothetical protein
MERLIGNSSLAPEITAMVGRALDWQWRDFLGKELPADYQEELRGLAVRRREPAGRLPRTSISLTATHCALFNY